MGAGESKEALALVAELKVSSNNIERQLAKNIEHQPSNPGNGICYSVIIMLMLGALTYIQWRMFAMKKEELREMKEMNWTLRELKDDREVNREVAWTEETPRSLRLQEEKIEFANMRS